MNGNKIQHDSGRGTWAYWLLIFAATIIALVCNYSIQISLTVQVSIWVTWLLISFGLFYISPQGKQAYIFAKEARIELLKVVWPSRTETVQTTMIVMAMVAVTGFVLWTVDVGMMWVIGKITHLG
jgi:preprotein translocase subunit SecE